jgi:hypothetical protein
VSEIITEGEGPFIEYEYMNYLLAVTVDLCPDKQRNFPSQLLRNWKDFIWRQTYWIVNVFI